MKRIWKRYLAVCIWISVCAAVTAQDKTPQQFGYRHFTMLYQGDTVNILVRSEKGEEQVP